MAKLREIPFESIPKNEIILLDGIMQSMRLIGNKTVVAFKFAFTSKGIWTKSKKVLFFKSKENFLAYSDLDYYKDSYYGSAQWFIFFPKGLKRPGNRIRFDDNKKAEEILVKYVRKATKKE